MTLKRGPTNSVTSLDPSSRSTFQLRKRRLRLGLEELKSSPGLSSCPPGPAPGGTQTSAQSTQPRPFDTFDI